MAFSDVVILMEMLGFVLVILTGGRNPKSGVLLLNVHEESRFNIIRKKIIPDKYVTVLFYYGVVMVILGFILQLDIFGAYYQLPK